METTSRQAIKRERLDRLTACFASAIRGIQADEVDGYPSSIRYLGGLYDRFDQPHLTSRLKRFWGRVVHIQAHENNFSPNRAGAQYIAGRSNYGGLLFNHFGHFLLETLARAWYIQSHSDDVYFFKTEAAQPDDVNELFTWQQELLAGLTGDINRIKIIHSGTVFEKFIVPKPGFVIRKYCRRDQAAALQAVGGKILEQNKTEFVSHEKVWLSRSGLGYGLVYGEIELEKALRQEGFLIFHPERHSVAEQIHVVENASVIAGFTGSAFHIVLLAKNNGARILHFSRVKEMNENYPICIHATGFAAEYYNFFERYDNGTTKTQFPTLANVYQDLQEVWKSLYRQGWVKSAAYS